MPIPLSSIVPIVHRELGACREVIIINCSEGSGKSNGYLLLAAFLLVGWTAAKGIVLGHGLD